MFEKHTWQKKEKITAERLNSLENGIEQALNEIAELKAKLDEKKIEVKEVKEVKEAVKTNKK